MPLSYEQRVELLAKARAAKKEKQNASKPAPTPATPAVIDSDTSSEEIEEPVKFPKSRIPNPKWLKNPETQKKVKVEGKITKESYVIDDDPEIKSLFSKQSASSTPEPKPVVKPKKPKKVKEAVKTLDIVVEPKEIVQVMEDIVTNDKIYKPKVKVPAPKKAPQIVISKPTSGINLFDY